MSARFLCSSPEFLYEIYFSLNPHRTPFTALLKSNLLVSLEIPGWFRTIAFPWIYLKINSSLTYGPTFFQVLFIEPGQRKEARANKKKCLLFFCWAYFYICFNIDVIFILGRDVYKLKMHLKQTEAYRQEVKHWYLESNKWKTCTFISMYQET